MDRVQSVLALLTPHPVTADDFAFLVLEHAGRWASVKVIDGERERELGVEVRVPWVRRAFGWQRRRLARRVQHALDLHRPLNLIVTVDVVK